MLCFWCPCNEPQENNFSHYQSTSIILFGHWHCSFRLEETQEVVSAGSKVLLLPPALPLSLGLSLDVLLLTLSYKEALYKIGERKHDLYIVHASIPFPALFRVTTQQCTDLCILYCVISASLLGQFYSCANELGNTEKLLNLANEHVCCGFIQVLPFSPS